MTTQDTYTRAKERVEEKIGFYVHLATYVVVNGLLVIVNLTTSPEYYWFKWPLMGWGVGIVFHGLSVFFFSEGSSIKERMIQREMESQQKAQQKTPQAP